MSAIFNDDKNRLQKVTDDLYCRIEIAEKRRKKIVPVIGYENAHNAHLSSFAISIEDFCRGTSSNQFVFLNNANDSCIEIGVRCFTDVQVFLDAEGKAKTLQEQCLSPCGKVQIRDDTIMTMIYTIPKGVCVAKLRKNGHRYYMTPLSLAMDECGTFILCVKKNKDSLYAFYNTPNYVCLIRFVHITDPEFQTAK